MSVTWINELKYIPSHLWLPRILDPSSNHMTQITNNKGFNYFDIGRNINDPKLVHRKHNIRMDQPQTYTEHVFNTDG